MEDHRHLEHDAAVRRQIHPPRVVSIAPSGGRHHRVIPGNSDMEEEMPDIALLSQTALERQRHQVAAAGRRRVALRVVGTSRHSRAFESGDCSFEGPSNTALEPSAPVRSRAQRLSAGR